MFVEVNIRSPWSSTSIYFSPCPLLLVGCLPIHSRPATHKPENTQRKPEESDQRMQDAACTESPQLSVASAAPGGPFSGFGSTGKKTCSHIINPFENIELPPTGASRPCVELFTLLRSIFLKAGYIISGRHQTTVLFCGWGADPRHLSGLSCVHPGKCCRQLKLQRFLARCESVQQQYSSSRSRSDTFVAPQKSWCRSLISFMAMDVCRANRWQ